MGRLIFFFFGLCVQSGAEKLDHDVGFLLFFYFCLARNGGVGSLFAISEWWDFWSLYFCGLVFGYVWEVDDLARSFEILVSK